uniref:Uncharacterized protein n=1 Tax=Anthurium amnicola TaxID=1678845 RepID=A0A1D1Y181_9ARAE
MPLVALLVHSGSSQARHYHRPRCPPGRPPRRRAAGLPRRRMIGSSPPSSPAAAGPPCRRAASPPRRPRQALGRPPRRPPLLPHPRDRFAQEPVSATSTRWEWPLRQRVITATRNPIPLRQTRQNRQTMACLVDYAKVTPGLRTPVGNVRPATRFDLPTPRLTYH